MLFEFFYSKQIWKVKPDRNIERLATRYNLVWCSADFGRADLTCSVGQGHACSFQTYRAEARRVGSSRVTECLAAHHMAAPASGCVERELNKRISIDSSSTSAFARGQ